jgi:predicted amidohydrolase YtcJ
MEEKLGRLEPGKYADLVVLSQDLFDTDPVEIPDVQVHMTMVEGKIVFRNEE